MEDACGMEMGVAGSGVGLAVEGGGQLMAALCEAPPFALLPPPHKHEGAQCEFATVSWLQTLRNGLIGNLPGLHPAATDATSPGQGPGSDEMIPQICLPSG